MFQRGGTKVSELSSEERIKLQRQCVEEHLRTESEGNWAGLYDTFVDSAHAVCEMIPLSSTFPMKDFYEVLQSAFSPPRFEVTGEYDVPGCSIREITITLTHNQGGEFCGVPSTGREAKFESAVFWLFDEDDPGRAVSERGYFDNETILRQLRGESDVPTGIGLAGRDRSTARSPAV
jgi:hypothetical protein